VSHIRRLLKLATHASVSLPVLLVAPVCTVDGQRIRLCDYNAVYVSHPSSLINQMLPLPTLLRPLRF